MAFSHPVDDLHTEHLRIAIAEAQKAIPTPTAFCVGCALVVNLPVDGFAPVVLATGYSRELPGNTHAEANALFKAKSLSSDQLTSLFPPNTPRDDMMAHIDVYTTLEPCSVRTSGLAPCTDALIAFKVKRCFIGAGEPDDFVKCEGARKLQDAGIEVIWLKGSEAECLAIARRGHEPKDD